METPGSLLTRKCHKKPPRNGRRHDEDWWCPMPPGIVSRLCYEGSHWESSWCQPTTLWRGSSISSNIVQKPLISSSQLAMPRGVNIHPTLSTLLSTSASPCFKIVPHCFNCTSQHRHPVISFVPYEKTKKTMQISTVFIFDLPSVSLLRLMSLCCQYYCSFSLRQYFCLKCTPLCEHSVALKVRVRNIDKNDQT